MRHSAFGALVLLILLIVVIVVMLTPHRGHTPSTEAPKPVLGTRP